MTAAPIQILLADDDKDDCLFFKEALEELKVSSHLTMVYDGEKLMKLLHNKKDELPDVLFLDLNMPRKNGLECLAEIKQIEMLKQFPIIIFSTSFEQDMLQLLYKNGAQHYIRKPNDFSQLVKVIQQALILTSEKNNSQPGFENFVIADNSETLNNTA